jgi:hypothetical protein
VPGSGADRSELSLHGGKLGSKLRVLAGARCGMVARCLDIVAADRDRAASPLACYADRQLEDGSRDVRMLAHADRDLLGAGRFEICHAAAFRMNR